MFIEAHKLIDLPVAAIDTQAKIGRIKEVIIDPENGRLLGFLVADGPTFLTRHKALSIIDVLEFDPNGLVTNSVENLVPPDEIVRLKEILDRKITLLGMAAKTESGKSLGHIEDLLIDTEGQIVAKYYLKDILGKTRILTADKVVKVETKGLPFGDKAVIFIDDVLEPPPDAAQVAV